MRVVPLPPPAAAAAVPPHAADGLALNRRLLLLEQQMGQILERLDRLEGRASVSASTIPAMPQAIQTGYPPDAEEILHAHVSEVAGTEPSTASDELSAYEALYLRYRTATLEVITERWQRSMIVDESDDAGKLKQICTGYQQIRSLRIGALRLGNKRVPDNVLIEGSGPSRCIAFLHVDNANAITARLSNLNQLVMRHRQVQFILMRDGFARVIRSPGGMAAMEAFRNGSGDGRKRTFWRPLDHDNRVAMEYVHQLVSDIVNRELDLPLPAGLELLARHDPDNWVVKLLEPA